MSNVVITVSLNVLAGLTDLHHVLHFGTFSASKFQPRSSATTLLPAFLLICISQLAVI